MIEHDFGWAVPCSDARDIERVRVNGRWFYARRQWAPTSLSYSTEADTGLLRNVYVNGIRFARAKENDLDDMEA